MSKSEEIKVSTTRKQLENELTQNERNYAEEQHLDPVEVYKATRLDYSNLTKYTFTESKCPIQNFTFSSKTPITKPSKEELAKQYYDFIDSSPKINNSNFKLELPKKTESDLIKPTNIRIQFNGDNSLPQYDYISSFTNIPSNSKIINHITSAISHFNFIDSSNPSLPVYQSLCSLQDSELLSTHSIDKPKNSIKENQTLFSSYGLYGLHDGMTSSTVHNFKSKLNNFIYQTIDRKFNKLNKYTQQNAYYSLFNDLFTKDNGKLKSSLVSSLIIPNIVNEFVDVYKNVPHAISGTFFNNFLSTTDPKMVCNKNKYGINYIPTFFTSHLKKTFSTDNLSGWIYPFINSTVDTSGNLKPSVYAGPINENRNYSSNFISSDIVQSNNIVFDDKHQFKLNEKYKDGKYLLDEPEIKTNEIEIPKIVDYKHYVSHSISVRLVGEMTLNPNKVGWDCCNWGFKKCNKDGKGSSFVTKVYRLVWSDAKGNIIKSKDNIGANGAPKAEYNGVWDGAKDSVSPEWMKDYVKDSVEYLTKDQTCNGSHFKYDAYIGKYLDNPPTIKKNVLNEINNWNRDFKEKNVEFEITPTETNINDSSIDSINKSLKNANLRVRVPPYTKINGKNTYYYTFGNGLDDDEIRKLKLSTTYATNKENDIKLYSATFGALKHNTYIYDERFFYILHKYFTTNKNLLCDILESEILNYFLKHPELLAIYRIQKGYLTYALSKLQVLNPRQNLSVVQFDSQDEETKNKIHSIEGNTFCFMNIETPIIGAMVHSDTLNLLDYNDYISDSMTKFKVKEFLTNDGKIIALDLNSNELKITNKNNIDSIYRNSIHSFGNISTTDLTLPGIFISDSGVPSDFIDGEHGAIKFVNVDAENGQKSLDKLSETDIGTLIVFSFDSVGAFKKSSWTDNPQLNEAISKAGSEQIMNIQMPYVMLLKQINPESKKIEYLFEYSTFNSAQNKNNIKVLYFRESENKGESKTFLNRESLKMDNCFKFVKNYCGVYEQTNPFGRLITNYNVGDY